MRSSFRLVVLVSVLLQAPVSRGATPSTQAWLLNFDSGAGAVEFEAVGRPSALKIHGKGSAPKGSLSLLAGKVSGKLSFDLETLDTGISMRNEHMKQKYLEVGKFKQAELSLADLSVPEAVHSEQAKVDRVPFQGTLTLHGTKKAVNGFVDVFRDGSKLNVKAEFGIKLTDYGISIPSFAGITVAEDVKIVVQTVAPVSTKQ